MAISISVSTSKIDIVSTGEEQVTLDDICTEINDTSVMEKTGSSYLVKRAGTATYRQLEVSSGCMVKFQEDDELNFQGITSSGTYNILYFMAGSEVEINAGCSFNLNYDNQAYARSYIYFYGKLTMNGTFSKPIVFKNYRSCYAYPRADQYWRYVVFKNATYSGGYLFYYSNYTAYYAKGLTYDIRYITVTNDGSNNAGRFYVTNSAYSDPDFVFRNWTIDNIYYPIVTYQSSYKFVDCIFKNSYTYPNVYNVGGQITNNYLSSREGDFSRPKQTYQPLMMFENCLFENLDLGVYGFRAYYSSVVYLKNCEFKDQSHYALYCSYGSYILINGITYTNCPASPLGYGNNAAFLHVREVSITVQESDGTPIENACVSIKQSQNKEKHCGFTNSDGKLLNGFGDPTLLVEKEETSNGVFTNWSNDKNSGKYHTIRVSKSGYADKELKLEITEDKEIVVVLYSGSINPTTIINSTLYDSVIY